MNPDINRNGSLVIGECGFGCTQTDRRTQSLAEYKLMALKEPLIVDFLEQFLIVAPEYRKKEKKKMISEETRERIVKLFVFARKALHVAFIPAVLYIDAAAAASARLKLLASEQTISDKTMAADVATNLDKSRAMLSKLSSDLAQLQAMIADALERNAKAKANWRSNGFHDVSKSQHSAEIAAKPQASSFAPMEAFTPQIVSSLARANIYPEPLARTVNPDAKVFVINAHETANEFVAIVTGCSNNNLKVVGLDVEFWYQSPATLQVAFAADIVAIFQLHSICGTAGRPLEPRNINYDNFPVMLKDLLESDLILKCGVGIGGDCQKIEDLVKIKTNNIVDCQKIAKSMNIGARSLASLYYSFVDSSLPFKRVDKESTGFSWELPDLGVEATEYAANDALASLLVYREMMSSKETASEARSQAEENWQQFRTTRARKEAVHEKSAQLPSRGGPTAEADLFN
ncbi:Exonuclease 3'-5' domain-containing protein 2 [Entophlyctis sp. JEL0112]|nr:Exonuclease 3'-5' domain-containing protein 2 [Entophlyctis sp. JEL0112]